MAPYYRRHVAALLLLFAVTHTFAACPGTRPVSAGDDACGDGMYAAECGGIRRRCCLSCALAASANGNDVMTTQDISTVQAATTTSAIVNIQCDLHLDTVTAFECGERIDLKKRLTTSLPLPSQCQVRFGIQNAPMQGELVNDCPGRIVDSTYLERDPNAPPVCKTNRICSIKAELYGTGCQLQCATFQHNSIMRVPLYRFPVERIQTPHATVLTNCEKRRALRQELKDGVAAWLKPYPALAQQSTCQGHINVTYSYLARTTCQIGESILVTHHIPDPCNPTNTPTRYGQTFSFAFTGPSVRLPAPTGLPSHFACPDQLSALANHSLVPFDFCNDPLNAVRVDIRQTSPTEGHFKYTTYDTACATPVSQTHPFTVAVSRPTTLVSPVPPEELRVECLSHVPEPFPLTFYHPCRGNFNVHPTIVRQPALLDANDTSENAAREESEDWQDIVWTWVDPYANPSDTTTLRYQTRILVRDDQPPVPIQDDEQQRLFPTNMTVQCMKDIISPSVLRQRPRANDTCTPADQLTYDYNEYVETYECNDRGLVIGEHIIRDRSGNEARYRQYRHAHDDQPPELNFNSTNYRHTCLWPPTGNYICFRGNTKALKSLWKCDNCANKTTFTVSQCESRDCASDDGRVCHLVVPDRPGNQPACAYIDADDEVCMRVERPVQNRARRYRISVNAHDECDNTMSLPLEFIVPGYAPGQARPRGQPGHPCDNHGLVEVSSDLATQFETRFGMARFTERIDMRRSQSNTHAPQRVRRTSSALSGFSGANAALILFIPVALFLTFIATGYLFG